MKLEVHDTYRKDEKISTNFELVDNEDVINKAYLDEKLKKNCWTNFIYRKKTTNKKYNTTNKT